jgi:hypothetical protein
LLVAVVSCMLLLRNEAHLVPDRRVSRTVVWILVAVLALATVSWYVTYTYGQFRIVKGG